MKIENIPKELKEKENWVCWNLVNNNDKATKIPINPITNQNARSNDSTSWTNFTTALKSCKDNRYSGIGYMFSKEDDIIGIDIDKCRDKETGKLSEYAQEIINTINSYTEVSPSNTGLHIFCKGKLPSGGRRNQQGLEMYSEGRFFTITGDILEKYPTTLEERTEAIKLIHSKYIQKKKEQNNSIITHTLNLSDEELIQKATSGKNGYKFNSLYNGNWEGLYPSQSEADLALCNMLAFWTNKDSIQIDSIFRSSGLYRKKWNEKHFGNGMTYGEKVIQEAINNSNEVYNPQKELQKQTTNKKVIELCSIDAYMLSKVDLPPIEYIIDGFLSVGLHLLAGAPKLGKSWLVLGLSIQTAKGLNVLGFKSNGGTVLYLCLEDNLNRIQSRQKDILQNEEPPKNVHFAIMAKTVSDGLIEQLDAWMNEHPDTKLICIDTLQKVRGHGKSDNQYANDYKDAGKLKELADKHSIAIILVHHTRKMGDGDIFNTVSGTTGLTGAVDSTFILKKDDRLSSQATLYATGRDIEEMELLLNFNKDNHTWELISSNATNYKEKENFNNNPIVIVLNRLLDLYPTWTSTPTELHIELMNLINEDEELELPITASELSKQLNKLAYKLSNIGIFYKPSKDKKRKIGLYRKASNVSDMSESQQYSLLEENSLAVGTCRQASALNNITDSTDGSNFMASAIESSNINASDDTDSTDTIIVNEKPPWL